jgi:hypothetical protein
MFFYPTVIIDDFLKDPLKVREYALTLDFTKGPNFSGTRTEFLHNSNYFFAHQICDKILMSCGIPYNNYKAEVHFHLTGEEFGNEGWPHTDFDYEDDTKFASIVYLNIEPSSLNSGTSIFRNKNFLSPDTVVRDMQTSFQTGVDNVSLKKELHDSYEETIRVGGIFNRMIAYDARRPHCGNGYFGRTKGEQRLTLLCFFKHIETSLPKNFTPIVYADMMSMI